MACFGAFWRLELVTTDLNRPVMIGFALCIGGAEIFNYVSIAGDILVTLLGSTMYMIGFWVTVGIWGLDAFDPDSISNTTTVDRCDSCQTSLADYQQPDYCPNCGQKLD